MADAEVRADLRSSPLFADLDPAHVDRLAAGARRVQLGAHTQIFREGQPAERCWLIHAGRVALEVHTPGDGAIVIATVGPGQIVGWSWLHPPYRWHLDARSVDDVEAFEWDAAALRAQCDEDPAFGYELLRRFTKVIVDRLQATRLQLLDVYGSDPPARRPLGSPGAAAEAHDARP